MCDLTVIFFNVWTFCLICWVALKVMFINIIRLLQLFIIIFLLMKRRSIFSELKMSVLTRSFIFRLFTILISLYRCAVADLLFRSSVSHKLRQTYSCIISELTMSLTHTESEILMHAVIIIWLRNFLSIKMTEQSVLKQTSCFFSS